MSLCVDVSKCIRTYCVTSQYVRDVSISIDSLALKLLWVSFADNTDLAALKDDTAILLYYGAWEVFKGLDLALLALFLLERFSLTDDLTAVVVQLAVLVTSTSGAIFWAAFDETTDNGAIVVDNVAGLVALETLEGRVV